MLIHIKMPILSRLLKAAAILAVVGLAVPLIICYCKGGCSHNICLQTEKTSTSQNKQCPNCPDSQRPDKPSENNSNCSCISANNPLAAPQERTAARLNSEYQALEISYLAQNRQPVFQNSISANTHHSLLKRAIICVYII